MKNKSFHKFQELRTLSLIYPGVFFVMISLVSGLGVSLSLVLASIYMAANGFPPQTCLDVTLKQNGYRMQSGFLACSGKQERG